MKIYIWGIGEMAQQYLNQNEVPLENILGFIETKRSRAVFWGKAVFEPNEIIDTEYDYILVCVYYVSRAIVQICDEFGISRNKIILMDNWEWLDGSPLNKIPVLCCNKILDNQANIDKKFPQFYQYFVKERDICAERYLLTTRNGFDLVEENDPLQREDYSGRSYRADYFRYRTFELVANEIIMNHVEGEAAELGVFRGTFSRLINEKLNNKTLYLFDTFESFDKVEFKGEVDKGRCPDNFYEGFLTTSEKKVLSQMPYPEKCVIKKGYFPDSLGENLKDMVYAFVSIDVDFEISILAGMRYFYPRLASGGVIFVHDYNNRFLEGVKQAIKSFEEEMGLCLRKVPLADEGGTLVILK